jgi:hypothetical protein
MSDILSNTFYSHRIGSKTGTATTSRVSTTFEVIDYDSYKDSYAVLYKSIAINHTQSWQKSFNATPYESDALYCQPGWNLVTLCGLNYIGTDITTSEATRVIVYKLYYKIKDYLNTGMFVTGSIDLATCIITANESAQSVTGQRVYGASIQISDEFVCYTYELDSVLQTGTINLGNLALYDGPVSLENWNKDKAIPAQDIWSRDSHVVGLINIKDGKNSTVGYHTNVTVALTDEIKEKFTPEQYATGVRIDLNKTEVIE